MSRPLERILPRVFLLTAHIDHEAIHAAIVAASSRPVLIAYGQEPIAGKDADLELYFSIEEQTYLTEKDAKVLHWSPVPRCYRTA